MSSKKEVAVYYETSSQWSTPAGSLPAKKLTMVIYAFADVKSDGEVVYPPNVTTEDFDKAAQDLLTLRNDNPDLKLILSIGGSTYSANFSSIVSGNNNNKIQTFVSSAKALKNKLGFDGIDIDWEFPNGDSDRDGLTKLVKACHEGMSGSILTLATPAGSQNYQWFDFANMKNYVNYYNLMAYHFGGSWCNTTTHASNLHEAAVGTAYSVDRILSDWKENEPDTKKVILGMPLFSTSFHDTDGLGESYSSVTTSENYRDLPSRGDYDVEAGASSRYESRVLKSYDTFEAFKDKAKYVKEHGLAGGFFWEAGRDKLDKDNAAAAFADYLGQ